MDSSHHVALLWFDCTLTFTTEVQYIWRRRFTGATIVYLFTRYAAVVERVFSLLTILLWTSTEEVRWSLACSDCH